MNEQYEKSLSKLELDKVLSLLADHASSQAAKDRCMAIRPSADADEIRHLLEETSVACKCITIKGSPSFGGLYDVGASLDRAYRGGCLSPEELLRIAGVLRAARQAKSYAEGEGAQEASVLDLYFQQITSNKYLEERIFNSILSKDEIADAASSELASIRRKIRQQSAKIRESLQKIITSPSYAKILQEPIVTIRSDRFVVPVKAECKGQLPGDRAYPRRALRGVGRPPRADQARLRRSARARVYLRPGAAVVRHAGHLPGGADRRPAEPHPGPPSAHHRQDGRPDLRAAGQRF